MPIQVTNLARELRIQAQSAVVAQLQLRGNARMLDSFEGTSFTARADVQSLSEGVHDVGLEIPRALPNGVTVEAILPERITLRLRVVKESGMDPMPGT